jgi:hypothetical protein
MVAVEATVLGFWSRVRTLPAGFIGGSETDRGSRIRIH